ncbi:MAG: mevalonate kinase [Candidatus Anstonellaceae archaeon]
MKFLVYSPAKIILFGEHFVVYNYPAIAAAIRPYNKIEIEFLKSKDYELQYYSTLSQHSFKINKKNKTTKHFLAFLYNFFLKKYPQLKEYKIKVRIKKIWPLKGVGNSSSIAGSFCYAVEKFLKNKITQKKIYDYIQESDKIAHGKPSGIDATTISYGNILEFKKGKKPKKIEFKQPKGWSFFLIGTHNIDKKFASTKRQIKLFAKNEGYKLGEKYKRIFLEAKKTLKKGEGEKLARLLEENQQLLQMTGVCSKTSMKIIRELKKIGISGVKITGAGGKGGSLICLVKQNKIKEVVKFFKENKIEFYKFYISDRGIFD